MELSVGELAQILGQSQPRVSRHLKILSDARVLERRKEGSWVFLTLADPDRVEPMFALIDAWSDKSTQTLFASDCARTEGIRSERAEAATRYFSGHAEVWDQIRSLHAAETEVESAIDEALGDQHLGRLVDIGTGTGRMIELFGPRASQAGTVPIVDSGGRLVGPFAVMLLTPEVGNAMQRVRHEPGRGPHEKISRSREGRGRHAAACAQRRRERGQHHGDHHHGPHPDEPCDRRQAAAAGGAQVVHYAASSYSSLRRHHTSVSLRPFGARSSHWYMPHSASSPRANAE